MMRRRTFLATASSMALAPIVPSHSQTRRPVRIALGSTIIPASAMTLEGDIFIAAFLEELARQGFPEGPAVVIERYSGEGGLERYEPTALAAVASAPDIIAFLGSPTMTVAAAAVTKTIPIVFTTTDALVQGVVSNLARPGGNVTGVNTTPGNAINGKMLELLRAAIPGVRRIGFVIGRSTWEGPVTGPPMRASMRAAAETLGLDLSPALAEAPSDVASFRAAVRLAVDADAVLVGNSAPVNALAREIGGLIAEAARPALAYIPEFVDGGGLMSYGSNRQDTARRAAVYVARILGGANPGDLPVQLPEKFDFVISLAAARRLGIALPPTLLAQATEIRE